MFSMGLSEIASALQDTAHRMDRLCSAQYSWGTKARERRRGEEQGFEVRALSHSHYCRSSFAALVRTFGPLRFQPANCGLEWTPGGRPTIFQPACSFWHNKGYQAPLSRGGYPSRNSENRYCSRRWRFLATLQ